MWLAIVPETSQKFVGSTPRMCPQKEGDMAMNVKNSESLFPYFSSKVRTSYRKKITKVTS